MELFVLTLSAKLPAFVQVCRLHARGRWPQSSAAGSAGEDEKWSFVHASITLLGFRLN